MPCLPAGTHSGLSEGVSAPAGYAYPPDRRAASSDSDTSVTGRHFQFQLSNFTDTLPPSDSKLSICLRFSLTQAVGRDRPNVGFGEGWGESGQGGKGAPKLPKEHRLLLLL